MFRDLKEYQNLQKLYEEKVSKPVNLVEKPNMPGSGVKSNVEVKSREEVGLKNNVKLGNNKKIDTSFDSSKIANDLLDKNKKVEVKSGPDLNAISKYTNNNRKEVTMKDFTPEKKVETEIKKNVEVEKKPLTNREKFDKKFIRDPKTKTLKRRGSVTARRAENLEKNRLRAQEMAKKRIELKKKAAAEAEAKSKEEIKSSYEYDAYDLVLEYLLSSEQAATIEEANYVMTEMDAETIQGIVEEQKKNLDEKFNIGKITLGQIGSTALKGALGYGAYKLAFGGKGNNNNIDTNTKTNAPNVKVDEKKKKNNKEDLLKQGIEVIKKAKENPGKGLNPNTQKAFEIMNQEGY